MATTQEQQLRRALGLELAQAARAQGAWLPSVANIAAPRPQPGQSTLVKPPPERR